MVLSHVLSDFLLLAACLFVFFRRVKHLTISNMLLWESFVLSIAAAAFFGIIRFAGFDWARPISAVFQQMASITGAVGLVAAIYSLVSGKEYEKNTTMLILGLGFVFLLVQLSSDYTLIGTYLPMLAMVLVLAQAAWAFSRGDKNLAIWLILAVAFFASSNFSFKMFGENEQSIDLFHYFTAAGVLSLGIALGQQRALSPS